MVKAAPLHLTPYSYTLAKKRYELRLVARAGSPRERFSLGNPTKSHILHVSNRLMEHVII